MAASAASAIGRASSSVFLPEARPSRRPQATSVSLSAAPTATPSLGATRSLASNRTDSFLPALTSSRAFGASTSPFKSIIAVDYDLGSNPRRGRPDGYIARAASASERVCEPPADEKKTAGKQIWLSDVIEKQNRPYFLNRKWTKKDLSYAALMVLLHGLCLCAPFTFSWDAFAVFGGLYVITGMLGITLSFHRNLSHKSFKLPKWLEYTFAYCGIQAVQGDPIEWVSAHRYHHQHCDTPQDPHTPYEGFWHSHMGWLLDEEMTNEKIASRSNVSDMSKDPFYLFIEKTYILHIVAMALLLYAIGGFPYIVWGLAVRTVWVYHITWAVNSAAHVWGYQSWNTGDLSRNNWWVALLSFGEGWHNNHHAFEYSARHGLDWWQLDMTWYTVRALEALGLATKVRLPSKEHMAKLSLE